MTGPRVASLRAPPAAPLGTARTALFNYLHARHTGGTFILRWRTPTRRAARRLRTRHPRWAPLARPPLGRGARGRGRGRRGVNPVPSDAAPAPLRRGGRTAARRGPGLSLLLHPRRARRRPQGPGGRPGAAALRRGVPPSRRRSAPRARRGSVGRSDSGSDRRGRVRRIVRGHVEIDVAKPRWRLRHRPDNGPPLYHFTVVVDDAAMQISHVIRRGPPLQHAQAHPAVPGARHIQCRLRPSAAHPQPRPDQDEQAQDQTASTTTSKRGSFARPSSTISRCSAGRPAPRRKSCRSTKSSSASTSRPSTRPAPSSIANASSGSTASRSAARSRRPDRPAAAVRRAAAGGRRIDRMPTDDELRRSCGHHRAVAAARRHRRPRRLPVGR